MPHISNVPNSPPVRMKVIDLIWLDAILDTLRRERRERLEVKDKLWLLAFSTLAFIAYVAFYAIR